MTLTEKIRQLQCRFVHDLIDQPALLDGDGLGGFAFERMVMPHTVEEETELLFRLQRKCVEETRLGIPALIHAEALHGLTLKGATSFPQAIGLAATFDTDLMGRVAAAIAEETKARGIRQVLSPTVDIAQDVRWGRVEETYGEDAFLVSRMAVAFCKAFEERGVVTTPKHFLANWGDGGRDSHAVEHSPRRLKEVFLKPYIACFKEAGSQAVMAAYHTVDGVPCGLSRHLLEDLLLKELAFDGIVVTDYGLMIKALDKHRIAHDLSEIAIRGIRAGLDREIPTIDATAGFETLSRAVTEGRIAEGEIDAAVRRILRVKEKIGLFTDPYRVHGQVLAVTRCGDHVSLAEEAAEKSLVLLKNDGLLPLGPGHRKVALVGSLANHPRLGGYSTWDIPVISLREGLSANAPHGMEIIPITGDGAVSGGQILPIPLEYLFSEVQGEPVQGMAGAYIHHPELCGQPVLRRGDGVLRLDLDGDRDLRKEIPARAPFSATWRGFIVAPRSGTYGIGVNANGGVVLKVDGETLIDRWKDAVNGELQSAVDLVAGKKHDLLIQYRSPGTGARISLGWIPPAEGAPDATDWASKLKGFDAVIVAAGITEGEGMDRAHLSLPEASIRLIRSCAAGPPTAVVLYAGSAVTMDPWLGEVGAVMTGWYPGERGGHALARALLGQMNPSGKLPITFPQDAAQAPLYYNPRPSGRNTGYVDMTGKPLFPFGHGLSYTRFEYRALSFSNVRISKDATVMVRCEIENTGHHPGEEVVQCYVRDEISSVSTPLLNLRGFQRISLKPGERKTVGFQLGPEDLGLYDETMRFVVEPGEFRIMLGSSSADIRLEGTLTVAG